MGDRVPQAERGEHRASCARGPGGATCGSCRTSSSMSRCWRNRIRSSSRTTFRSTRTPANGRPTAASCQRARHGLTRPITRPRTGVVAQFEKEYLTRLIGRAGGNMSKAARLASIDRTTLYRLMDKHSLPRRRTGDRVSSVDASQRPGAGASGPTAAVEPRRGLDRQTRSSTISPAHVRGRCAAVLDRGRVAGGCSSRGTPEEMTALLRDISNTVRAALTPAPMTAPRCRGLHPAARCWHCIRARLAAILAAWPSPIDARSHSSSAPSSSVHAAGWSRTGRSTSPTGCRAPTVWNWWWRSRTTSGRHSPRFCSWPRPCSGGGAGRQRGAGAPARPDLQRGVRSELGGERRHRAGARAATGWWISTRFRSPSPTSSNRCATSCSPSRRRRAWRCG